MYLGTDKRSHDIVHCIMGANIQIRQKKNNSDVNQQRRAGTDVQTAKQPF